MEIVISTQEGYKERNRYARARERERPSVNTVNVYFKFEEQDRKMRFLTDVQQFAVLRMKCGSRLCDVSNIFECKEFLSEVGTVDLEPQTT